MNFKLWLIALPSLMATVYGHPQEDLSYKLSARVAGLDKELVSREIALDSLKETRIDSRSSCGGSPGLAQNLWVDIPANCAACIIQCLTVATGSQYVAGSTVASVSLWRHIGTCGVGCVFSGGCTSRQAGTWQAQQPSSFDLHSK